MGQFPAWAAGSKITSAQLTQMEVNAAFKASDTMRSSTTTITADPDLQINLGVGTFLIVGYWGITGGTTGSSDMKVTIAYTGTVGFGSWTPFGPTTASSTAVYQNGGALGATAALGTYSTTIPVNAGPQGLVTTSSSGSLQVQWAQNTSNATATTLKAGSWLYALQIA